MGKFKALTQTAKNNHQHRRDNIGDEPKAHHQRRDVYAPCLGQGRQSKIQTGHATKPDGNGWAISHDVGYQ